MVSKRVWNASDALMETRRVRVCAMRSKKPRRSVKNSKKINCARSISQRKISNRHPITYLVLNDGRIEDGRTYLV